MAGLVVIRNRRLIPGIVSFAVLFLGNGSVFAQRGQPAPRPGPPAGQPFRPGQPGVQPGNQQGKQFQPNQPGRPVVPGVPQQAQPQQQTGWVTAWICSRCQAELGRGNVPPPLATCPKCGCVFANAPMEGKQVSQAPGLMAGMTPALERTIEIEGSLLGGLVLVGLIRLGVDRMRRPADAAPV